MCKNWIFLFGAKNTQKNQVMYIFWGSSAIKNRFARIIVKIKLFWRLCLKNFIFLSKVYIRIECFFNEKFILILFSLQNVHKVPILKFFSKGFISISMRPNVTSKICKQIYWLCVINSFRKSKGYYTCFQTDLIEGNWIFFDVWKKKNEKFQLSRFDLQKWISHESSRALRFCVVYELVTRD